MKGRKQVFASLEIPDSGMAGASTHTRVAELLDEPRGGKVLDIGAGTGSFSDWLLSHGYDITALGIETNQYRGTAPFIECNVDEGLPFADASVQGIVAVELIEHLENPHRFVREVARCLELRGWILITTPNIASLSSKVSMVFRNYPIYFGPDDYERNGHISPVSLLDLSRIARRAGLTIEATTYNLGLLPIPRVRHWLPLKHPVFRNHWWGESLVILLRKTSEPMTQIARG